MKYKFDEGNYLQASKISIQLLNGHNDKVPYSTRWLWVHLNYLEHQLTGKEKDWFWHTHKELTIETGISKRNIMRGINQLKSMGLLKTWFTHWKEANGKASRKHFTCFQLLTPEKDNVFIKVPKSVH